MYKRVAVLYDGSVEGSRALGAALSLGRAFDAELQILIMKSRRPLYSAYAQAVGPETSQTLEHDRESLCSEWQEIARNKALAAGVEPAFHVFESGQQEKMVEFLRTTASDLLVVGLHHKGSLISRLWRAIYELAEDAPCHVLGVH